MTRFVLVLLVALPATAHTISGTVVGPDGPVAGATVEFRYESNPAVAGYVTTSNAQGQFSGPAPEQILFLRAVPPPGLPLSVFHDGIGLKITRDYTVRIRLKRTVTITGEIRDGAGQRVPGSVSFYSLTSATQNNDHSRQAPVATIEASSGSFSFETGEDFYSIHARAAGRTLAAGRLNVDARNNVRALDDGQWIASTALADREWSAGEAISLQGTLTILSRNLGSDVSTIVANGGVSLVSRFDAEGRQRTPDKVFQSTNLTPTGFPIDVMWMEDSDRFSGLADSPTASLQDNSGALASRLRERFHRFQPTLGSHAPFDEREIFGELPLFSSGEQARFDWGPPEQWGYAYLYAERPSIRAMTYNYDAATLARDSPNLDLHDADGYAGADAITISFLVSGTDASGTRKHFVRQVVLQGEELHVPEQSPRPKRRSIRK